MQKHLLSIIMILAAYCLQAQIIKPLDVKIWPESDSTSPNYTIDGYRHGVTHFPKVELPHVEYTPSETFSFDKYHSANVIYYWLQKWAEQYPDLVDLYEVGKSYEGRPIIQMTVTNKKTGKASDKPAAFFEGNRHSGEVSSAESVMWLMKHLLESYGNDPEITNILNKNAVFLKPINNPDGHNLYMNTAQSNRSTVRPNDDDGDGLFDEDAPDDLNCDGMILRMRYIDTAKGNYIIDPRDPSGRLMKSVPAGQGKYLVAAEGIDNDCDGSVNEDGIGGLDLHRNYVENWRPSRENSSRGWTQGGSGEYPLSETETRAVVSFLLANPNVYIANSMDTRVPMHLRAPSTSASEDRMYPEDIKWYEYFDQLGNSITGYGRAGDVYKDYGGGTPLFGHGPDFGYWYYGAIWYGDEIWDGGKIDKDYNNDGTIDELDKLIWDDQENDGMGFIEWCEFRHPTLGLVEIGGWDPKFYSQNSPAKQIEKWAKNQALFNLAMVKHLPELTWGDVEIKKLKSYKSDSTDYQVKVSYKNIGKLPTALKQADLVKIVRPDNLQLTFGGALVTGASGASEAAVSSAARASASSNSNVAGASVAGSSNIAGASGGSVNNGNSTATPSSKPNFKIMGDDFRIVRAGRGAAAARGAASSTVAPIKYSKNTGYTDGGATNSSTMTIRVYGDAPVKFTATVSSTRAGILPEKEIVIN